jgi:hypothetical protein
MQPISLRSVMDAYPKVATFNNEETCTAIFQDNKDHGILEDHSAGWAPAEAAELLTRSMLEWQSSLAESLKIWVGRESEGELILARVNLGSLVEGFLKLFLCVFYKDYAKDEAAARKKKRDQLIDPDGQQLETLRVFFAKRVWHSENEFDWDPWIRKIQQRRNTVHAYKKREIGSFEEWYGDLRIHLVFIMFLNGHLPYP